MIINKSFEMIANRKFVAPTFNFETPYTADCIVDGQMQTSQSTAPTYVWPIFLFSQTSVGAGHPKMHNILQENVTLYLEKNPGLREWFQRLVAGGKTLFLITNSPYHFV